MPNPSLLIFDVNETLLDMQPLAVRVNALLNNQNGFTIWFPSLLHYSLVETVSNSYHDFTEVARATLAMTAKMMGVDCSTNEIRSTLAVIASLPPHPEVQQALSQMKNNGYRMVALTNGKPDIAMKQLNFAGLTDLFTDVYSVEAVRKYKPTGAPYRFVLEEQQADPENALMVAAHGWDIAGAQRIGMQTAFIERSGKSLFPLAKNPTYTCRNCEELAAKITAR